MRNQHTASQATNSGTGVGAKDYINAGTKKGLILRLQPTCFFACLSKSSSSPSAVTAFRKVACGFFIENIYKTESSEMITLCSENFIQSVLMLYIIAWYGNLIFANKYWLSSLLKVVSRILGEDRFILQLSTTGRWSEKRPLSWRTQITICILSFIFFPKAMALECCWWRGIAIRSLLIPLLFLCWIADHFYFLLLMYIFAHYPVHCWMSTVGL